MALLIGDFFRRDLTGQIARNRRQATFDCVAADIVQTNVKTSQRTHMGNASAHLTGANDTDGFHNKSLRGVWP